jgi:hypothetical protein
MLWVRSTNQAAIARVVLDALERCTPEEPAADPSVPGALARVSAAVVTAPRAGWCGVFLAPLVREERANAFIGHLASRRLICGALHLSLEDGVLRYDLYDQGEFVHAFCSHESQPGGPDPLLLEAQLDELREVLELDEPDAAGSPDALAGVLRHGSEPWTEGRWRSLLRGLGLPLSGPNHFESLSTLVSPGPLSTEPLAVEGEAWIYVQGPSSPPDTQLRRLLH